MKLTGKCKQDFWMSLDLDTLKRLNDLPGCCQNALIIEYLDSIGIYVYVKPRFHYGGLSFDGFIDGMDISKIETEYFKTRTEAINAAIEKVNELINKI